MNNKKTLNEIGIKYAIMAVIVLCVQFFSAFLLKKYNMEWLKENVVFASYILSIVCNDFLALLIILVLTKNMPKCNFPKRKLGVGNALTVYSISISIVLVGGLLGNFLQIIITGKVGNAAGDLISSGSNFILGLVSVGIIAPVFEELNEELEDVNFVKVDIDQSMDLAQKFRIVSVPTMKIFKDGQEVDTLMGFMPKEAIKSKVEAHL